MTDWEGCGSGYDLF